MDAGAGEVAVAQTLVVGAERAVRLEAQRAQLCHRRVERGSNLSWGGTGGAAGSPGSGSVTSARSIGGCGGWRWCRWDVWYRWDVW